MNEDLAGLLVQLPVVGVFAWFALELMKRAEKKDAAYLAALNKLAEGLQGVKESLHTLTLTRKR
jgi:Na+/phosphate symporter